MSDATPQEPLSPPAQVGISVEPMSAIESQWVWNKQQESQPISLEDQANLPLKLLNHFYNFAMSFASKNPQIVNAPNQECTDFVKYFQLRVVDIPANVLNKWYQTAQNRIMKESGVLP